MPRGGVRAGAGRKAGSTVQKREPVGLPGLTKAELEQASTADLHNLVGENTEALVKAVLDRQDDLIQALFDLATGAYYEKVEVDQEGQPVIRVYRDKPVRAAAEFLLTMAHGKPTQRTTKQVDTTIHVMHQIPRPGHAPAIALPDGTTIDVEPLSVEELEITDDE